MKFLSPEYLWLLLVIIPMIWWYIRKKRFSQATMRYSSLKEISNFKKPLRQHLRHLLFIMRISAIALLISALAKPVSEKFDEIIEEGIDIVIALDISGSMQAMDFKPNRLEASKDIAIEFIAKQKYDRIGLVVFSAESFTQCPVTLDHAVLISMFKDIQPGLLDDGTAIGYGLATAVNNLVESKSKSKIIILLTDGENNAGDIDPLTAADLAAKYGIKVYTIGVGKNGLADMPVKSIFGETVQKVEVRIDEETLKLISEKTDGRYFRATGNMQLKEIYKEIDKLEKDKIRENRKRTADSKFLIFLLSGFILICLEVLLKLTVFRTIP